MLVRFSSRRKTVWEGEHSAADIQRAEFTYRDGEPQFEVSVYDVAAAEIVQTYAEHAAAIPLNLSYSLGIDCAGHEFRTRTNDGQPCFVHIKTRHREILVLDISGLQRLVAHLRDAVLRGQCHDVPKSDVSTYARGRVAMADPEWAVILALPATKGWLRDLARPASEGV